MADNVENQHEIKVEVDGQTIAGTYSVWAGTITVTTIHGHSGKAVDSFSAFPAI